MLYGGTSQMPDTDASDAVWLTYLKDKYERKLFADKPSEVVAGGGVVEAKRGEEIRAANGAGENGTSVQTADLLCLEDMANARTEVSTPNDSSVDFFSQFGV